MTAGLPQVNSLHRYSMSLTPVKRPAHFAEESMFFHHAGADKSFEEALRLLSRSIRSTRSFPTSGDHVLGVAQRVEVDMGCANARYSYTLGESSAGSVTSALDRNFFKDVNTVKFGSWFWRHSSFSTVLHHLWAYERVWWKWD